MQEPEGIKIINDGGDSGAVNEELEKEFEDGLDESLQELEELEVI